VKSGIFLFLSIFGSTLAFGHGLHSIPKLEKTNPSENQPIQVEDLGSVIAVKRRFSMDFEDCKKHYDIDDSACTVVVIPTRNSHHDYTFPIEPEKFAGSHAVTFEATDVSYTISYFGPANTMEGQLSYIKQALRKRERIGKKTITAQLYRAAEKGEAALSPNTVLRNSSYKETLIGPVISVRRKIAIRYSDCEETFEDSSCWVRIVEDSVPDHPGPAGAEEPVKKEHKFSSSESVEVELENLYGDYLIRYQGPETQEALILGKIKEALLLMKGSEKELFLECSMFSVEDRGNNERKTFFSDTKVSSAIYFKVAMPLEYKLCEKTLNTFLKNCRASFSIPILGGFFNHPGGDDEKFVRIGTDGTLDLFGTYSRGDAYWRLRYTLFPESALTPQSLIKQGLDSLASIGENSLNAYGFRSKD
jgi:hypothetical protein